MAEMEKNSNKIIVVGAGITGIRVSLDFAEQGYRVFLVDKAFSSGGILSLLDHQFPNNHCGMCRMLPMIDRDQGEQVCLRKGLFHENIQILNASEVLSVEGNPGQLKAVISRIPTGVDRDKCIGCLACEDVCPESGKDMFNNALSKRKAIYLPTPHLTKNQRVIDWNVCSDCKACIDVCKTGAITLSSEPVTHTLSGISAVIMATGVELYDPSISDLYGYGVLPNVVTAAGFERIMSSSGPYEGNILRPSDKKEIKKIAWLQCVGSRNIMTGADYCSSVCCMFAVKEAVLAVNKIGREADTSIFYMDMRTFGRDFQRYRDQAEREKGIKFVRCRVHSVEPNENTDDLKISYVDSGGKQIDEIFDLVVLSTGKKPDQQTFEWAGKEGVFSVNDISGFKDIADSVTGAGAVSMKAFEMIRKLGLANESQVKKKAVDINISEKRPRFLVFLCACGDSIKNTIDMARLEKEIKNFSGDHHVLKMASACTEEGWQEIKKAISSIAPNRLIFVGCDGVLNRSRIHEIEENAGIPGVFMDTIDVIQFSRLIQDKSQGTMDVLFKLKMSIARLASRNLSVADSHEVTKSSLIIGAGPAGLKAALTLAAHDVEVFLIEKKGIPGGNIKEFQEGEDKNTVLKLIADAENHPLIHMFFNTTAQRTMGIPGYFVTTVDSESGMGEVIQHGTVIIASGGKKAVQNDYNYSDHSRIITSFEMEKELASKDSGIVKGPVSSVVMIQCAGSREEPNNYCSRICCLKSLRNAIRIKELHPDSDVYIFYRDMMTYGESEKLYTEARRKGVLFVPFDPDNKPDVKVDSENIFVAGYDPLLGAMLKIKADWVSLATGIVPNSVQEIKTVFGIQTTVDGFIKEVDSKWRPVDTGREGIFVCGVAKSPQRLDEVLLDATAAAQRALRILEKTIIHPSSVTARVKLSLCSACGICERVCPYSARYLDTELNRIMVDPASCQGCGTCVSECPNSATALGVFEEEGILNALEAI